MKKYLILIITVCLLFTNHSFAQQAGDLDPTFGEDGLVHFPDEWRISAVEALSNGKILVLGDENIYGLNADGSTDTSFGNNGIVNIGCAARYGRMNVMTDEAHIYVCGVNCQNGNTKIYDISGNLVHEMNSGFYTPTPISSERILLSGGVWSSTIQNQNIFDANDVFTFLDAIPNDQQYRSVAMTRGEDYTITLGGTHDSFGDIISLYVSKIPDDSLTAEWIYADSFSVYLFIDELSVYARDVFIQSDGKILYYYSYNDFYSNASNVYIRRLNPDGSPDYTFNTITFESGPYPYIALNSYDEIIVSLQIEFSESSDLQLYDKDGSFVSSYAGYILADTIEDTNFHLREISVQADNSVLALGIDDLYSTSDYAGFITKFTSVTDYPYSIAGNLFIDDNDDCNYDTTETGLEDWLIKIQGDYTTYARSRADGSYNLGLLDTGIYTVNLINPNYLWEDVCIEDTTFNVNADNPNYTVDFAVRSANICPLLEVDIATPIVRRCFDTYYIVRYRNSGTVLAENAYVEVQLDPYFTFLDASIPSTNMGNNLYQFDIGDIGAGEREGFKIDVNVDCNSTVLGQTHCMEAHIYPDSICASVLPTWDGSSIEVDAQCLGDSIEFKIENIGANDMSDSLEYVIIEDDLIWQRANFQLDSGDSIKYYKPANGLFHRFEAEQSPGHPGNSMPSIFVEGCGTDDNGEISVGYVNYFLLNEGDAFVSIDCQENVGSYDPNDKQAFPVGYGASHFITDSTDLEYMIRFQNTGTDTAFNIVIRDTISPHLNIETLRPGVASHDYRYDIDSSNIAVFHFENIMLPDSNISEAASHGFIKFDIQQKQNNPIGIHIMNDAAIYFDFNEPIITNEVFHTIGEDFMGIVTSIITPPEVQKAGISVNVFPNPFDEYTRFEVQGEAVKELHLNLYDMTGREVLQQHATHQQHITLYKNQLTPGVYVFRLMDEKQQLATGKLVIE